MKCVNLKTKNIIRGIIVFFLFFYSVYLQYIPVLLFKMDVHNISPVESVLLSTFSSTIVLFILFFIYRKDLIREFKIFKDNFIENIDIGFRYWMLGLFIMMISNVIITYFLKGGGANNEVAVQKMIKTLPWLMVIDAGIIAPFNEEIVFRKTLKDIFNNPIILCILSFLFFGGAHVISDAKTITDYLYIIPYGALGASFAYSYYKTNTVFTSMSMHIFHNTVLILLSIFIL